MGGEGSIMYGTSQIEQIYDNKNPVDSSTQIKSAAANARSFSRATDPFIDAQNVVFAQSATPSYAYLKFTKVPHNYDKIILTDTSGQQVCFEFVNSTTRSTRSFGKLQNRPNNTTLGRHRGRGTWRVLLTGSEGDGLRTGSMKKDQVATAMNLFRHELGLALNIGALFITCSDRVYKETAPADDLNNVPESVVTYPTTSGSRLYVRLDQVASGADGNRRIDFRFRGFSSGNYILNGVTASDVYGSIKSVYSASAYWRNGRTRVKFVRRIAYKKYGMGFLSGSNMFILPMDGYISEIERKIVPFSDNKMMAARRMVSNAAGTALVNAGPATLLTSTLGGMKEWNETGHGYKSSGAGFTYNNDMFGTDSIVYGGRKR